MKQACCETPMKSMARGPILAILILLGTPTLVNGSIDTCQEIEQAKKKDYGFQPSQLSEQERQQKANELDRFWGLVESKGGDGVVCLREMLRAETEDGYFVFDSSTLLYKLDQSPESLEAISQALVYTDLKDVNPISYVSFLQSLSHRGIDIGPLADKYLTHPEVESYVPMHALRVDRAMGGLFLYGSMAADLVDRYLVPHLKAKDRDVRATVALLLAFNMTEEGLRTLGAFDHWQDLKTKEKEAIGLILTPRPRATDVQATLGREEVLHRLRDAPEYSGDFYGVAGNTEFILSAIERLNESDLHAVREARRKSMVSVSDERLYEYYALSAILIGVIDRLGLYREYLNSLRALE